MEMKEGNGGKGERQEEKEFRLKIEKGEGTYSNVDLLKMKTVS